MRKIWFPTALIGFLASAFGQALPDLEVTMDLPGTLTVGSPFAVRLAITNLAAVEVRTARLEVNLPETQHWTLQNSTTTQGTVNWSGGEQIIVNLGKFAASGNAGVNLTLTPKTIGTFVVIARVLGSEPESRFSNNSLTLMADVQAGTTPPQIQSLRFSRGETVPPGGEFQVLATVLSQNGGVNVSFFLDGVNLGASSQGTIFVRTARFGPHEIEAVATDASGLSHSVKKAFTVSSTTRDLIIYPQVISGKMFFLVACQPSDEFRIEATANFEQWHEVGRITGSDPIARFEAEVFQGDGTRFYRAVRLPPE